MKTFLVGTELFHADGKIGLTEVTVAFAILRMCLKMWLC